MPDDPALDGVVSLGMATRTDVECPRCEHTEAAVTHNGAGDVVLCCTSCQKFWKADDDA